MIKGRRSDYNPRFFCVDDEGWIYYFYNGKRHIVDIVC
jgi:hypothetical protein